MYEPGRSQLTVRVPEEPEERFPAVVRAADALLAVTREAALSPPRPRPTRRPDADLTRPVYTRARL